MRYETRHVLEVYREGLEKEAATPTLALQWMDSKSPALRRMGHMYSRGVTSKTFDRATRDVHNAVNLNLLGFGGGFTAATAKGRLLQGLGEAALSQAPVPVAKKLKKIPMYATTFMRNYPGASTAMGLLPQIVGG